MARNVDRDAREAEKRKKRIIEEGFKLFAEHGIENVSLLTVAEAADVGVATMYNYYQNKINLIVAISTQIWSDVFADFSKKVPLEMLAAQTAYENIEAYTDVIIHIFKTRPEILRFSSNYKTYIRREKATKNDFAEHLDSLEPIAKLFHESCVKARVDGSIRTDIPEDEMFTTISLTMLAMAERFAEGIVWTDNGNDDKSNELEYIKEMILKWCKP